MLKKHCYLDAILTVVDVKHIHHHLARARSESIGASGRLAHLEMNESVQQICFADRVLLNKADLVSADELEATRSLVRSMNVTARIFSTTHALGVALSELIGIHAFDAKRHLANWERVYEEQRISALQGDSQTHGVVAHSITCEGEVDIDLFNTWIRELLSTKGDSIFRTKASVASCLSICSCARIFSGVTMYAFLRLPRRLNVDCVGRVSWPLEATSRSLSGNRCI